VRQRTDQSTLDEYAVFEAMLTHHLGGRLRTRFYIQGFLPNRIHQIPFFYFWKTIMTKLNQYVSAVFLAVTLASAVGCSSTPQKEGTGQYIDDSVITAKVKAALIESPVTKATEINVETFKGIVQLSGFVTSQDAANKAVDLARGVSGVKSVTNDMRLK
jgi:osmotically-inducible protein OsmY